MNTPRSRKIILLLSDILVLNITFILLSIFHVYFITYSKGSINEIIDLIIAGNKILTVPWVILFLIFGFYKVNWRLSFFNIFLTVSVGIFILMILTMQGGNFFHTPNGRKLIMAYWFLMIISIYTSRFIITAFFDFIEEKKFGKSTKRQSVCGAGYSEKTFNISKSHEMVTHSKAYLFSKRLFDFFLSIITLIIFLPTMIIIAIIVKITDFRGPIFFKQKRLGKNGKVFTILKFRSMVYNAEEMLKKNKALYEEYIRNNFKLPPDRDPRITKIGSFLRKTSLDELPQLFNIISGKMSIVGPRPIIPDELVKYDKFSKKHLSVKPGVTGWWQVAGRSNIDYPDRIYLEMYYVEKASFFFDLRIVIETIPTVLFAKGAH